MRPLALFFLMAVSGGVFAMHEHDLAHWVENDTPMAYSQPVAGLSPAAQERFRNGRSLFRTPWVVAPSRDEHIDGLGPLYNRLSCIACHPANGRGRAPAVPSARMQSMLVRLSVPGAGADGGPQPHPAYGDQLNEEGVPGVSGEGRAELGWEHHVVTLADGTQVELRAPKVTFSDLAYGPLGDDVLTSLRVGPPVFGMGLFDAVSDETLNELAGRSRALGLNGRVNRVHDVATGHRGTGRFGHKSNQPSLRQQIAAALIGDLGITSSLFPEQNCTPAQLACRQARAGGHPELTDTQLDDLEFYLAHVAVPARRNADDPRVRHGEQLFLAVGCAACHVPELVTGEHPRYPLLSRRTIQPYSDLLVHDMGEGLADRRPDFAAGGRDWRTPPLWGIGLVETVNGHSEFLHDGRARNLTEAVLWHGGSAEPARQAFERLSAPEREALEAFLKSL